MTVGPEQTDSANFSSEIALMLHFSRLVERQFKFLQSKRTPSQMEGNLDVPCMFLVKLVNLVNIVFHVPVNDDHHLHLGPLHPLLPVLRQNKGVLSRVLNRGASTEELQQRKIEA